MFDVIKYLGKLVPNLGFGLFDYATNDTNLIFTWTAILLHPLDGSLLSIGQEYFPQLVRSIKVPMIRTAIMTKRIEVIQGVSSSLYSVSHRTTKPTSSCLNISGC